jgi:hypothetical protein
MPKLTFVSGWDWTAVYRDGKVVYQDHHVYEDFYEDLLQEAGFEVELVDVATQEPLVDAWSMVSGAYPETWPPTEEDEKKMSEDLKQAGEPVER